MTGPQRGEAHVASSDPHLLWFEFGTVHQPPRSVLGATLFERAHNMEWIAANYAVRAIVGAEVAGKIVRVPSFRRRRGHSASIEQGPYK